ncbi:MAG: beta-propeller domain-containing protein [Eubacterium sp.]|nr:beta-propeller domain-containing protein [Eubacterium sp.]
MEDRELEKRLKDENVDIPESLKPENMKTKLDEVKMKAMAGNISPSEDVPVISKNEPKKHGSAKKILYTLGLAASFALVFGLGYFANSKKPTNDKKSPEQTETVDKTGEDDTKEEGIPHISNGYEKSYKALSRIKDYYYGRYDKNIVFEETADEAKNSTTGALNKGGTDKLTPGVTPSFTDTNERTEGVHEDDVIKTDGNYIYVYNSSREKVEIYSAKNGKTELQSKINLVSLDSYDSNIYVAGDRLITIGYREKDSVSSTAWVDNNETVVMIYNIKDRTEPKLIESVSQDGSYSESRLVDGYLYVFSNYYVNTNDMDENDPETYIPTADGSLIPDDDIYVIDNCISQSYTVIKAIDIEDATVVSRKAFLGGSDLCYVSQDNIYLIDSYYNSSSFSLIDKSGIVRVSYKDGKLKTEAKGTFAGYVKDHYSIDEADGYVRVCSTYYSNAQKNAVYVLNMDLEKVGVLKGIAKNETIKSVRFMGDTAYMVTFRRTDPLFAVDLSDPENPEIIGYIKLPGFSDYLQPYGDNLLLGVGFSADETTGRTSCIKLSMFDISDPTDIKELATKELLDYNHSGVIDNTKNFMFDKESGLFGTTFYSNYYYNEDEKDYTNYGIYTYDEKKGFELKLEAKLGESSSYGYDNSPYYTSVATRGMIIGDYVYVVTADGAIQTFDKTTFKQVQ